MATPREVFLQVFAQSGSRLEAIQTIRQRFGLSLIQAKEVMVIALGLADSLEDYEAQKAKELEEEFGD